MVHSMTTGIGRFALLSLGLHLLLLTSWYNHETRIFQADQPLQVAFFPPPAVIATPQSNIHNTSDAQTNHTNSLPQKGSIQLPMPEQAPQATTIKDTRKPGSADKVLTKEPIATLARTTENQRATTPAENPVIHTNNEHIADKLVQGQLQMIFASYFAYPPLAQRRNWQGEVRLGLRIEADGQLSNIRVVQSSGYSILDNAAIKSLRQIAAFPDADNWLHGRNFDTVLPIEYRLIDS
jgi:protein TonB